MGLVDAIREPNTQDRDSGFEMICRRYWKPVYQFIRIEGKKSNEESKDLTQGFFLLLAEKNYLSKYAPERGSLRTYLKLLVRGFLGHEEESQNALKRGGGVTHFSLDFIEIVFIVVPLVAPALFMADISPVWLGVMMGINLQTSFLTPPFAWALFYMRGVAPPEVRTVDIYKGVMPYVAIQVIALALLWNFPVIATWLPDQILR